jgi:hypothetical protein
MNSPDGEIGGLIDGSHESWESRVSRDRGTGRSRRPHGLREPAQQSQHPQSSRGADREGRRRNGSTRLPTPLAGNRNGGRTHASSWRCSPTCTARSATARRPCSPSSRLPRAPTPRPGSCLPSTTSDATTRNAGWPAASIGANSSKPGLAAREAADVIWTLASERTYLELVRDRMMESRHLRAMGRRTARGRPPTAAIEGRVPAFACVPSLAPRSRPAEAPMSRGMQFDQGRRLRRPPVARATDESKQRAARDPERDARCSVDKRGRLDGWELASARDEPQSSRRTLTSRLLCLADASVRRARGLAPGPRPHARRSSAAWASPAPSTCSTCPGRCPSAAPAALGLAATRPSAS